jgi:hypothetical protein
MSSTEYVSKVSKFGNVSSNDPFDEAIFAMADDDNDDNVSCSAESVQESTQTQDDNELLREEEVVETANARFVSKKRKRDAYKSDENKASSFVGVSWNKKSGKWVGMCTDRLAERSKTAKRNQARQLYTKYFDDENECFEALKILRVEVEAKNSAIWCEQASTDPLTRNIERAPADARDAKWATPYWVPNPTRSLFPTRMVLKMDKKNGTTGLQWIACCTHVDSLTGLPLCNKVAKSTLRSKKALFCGLHGKISDTVDIVDSTDSTAKLPSS